MSENFPAGSATGIDLALTPYGYAAEARDGHVTFFKERPTGFDQPKWNGLVKVVELYDRAPATSAAALSRDAERWRFSMRFQGDGSEREQPAAIIALWRKVYAEHRLRPTREEYEAAIDAAIDAEKIDTPTAKGAAGREGGEA